VTVLYLVRHGETDWNREQRLQGTRDIPLNETGVAQAHELAGYFSTLPITCVISSPLVRASQTAAILADACACPVRVEARLQEIDHGSWSGLTLPDIGSRFPALVAHEQLRPEAFDVGGGERLPDVYRRVAEVLADLLSQHEKEHVLVVGHGITLALMSCAANGVDPALFPEHLPPNASGVVLTFSRHTLVDSQPVRRAKTATPVEVAQ
jgi:broad specificity phosphatase PhoE